MLWKFFIELEVRSKNGMCFNWVRAVLWTISLAIACRMNWIVQVAFKEKEPAVIQQGNITGVEQLVQGVAQ